jgi:hypothetical protein
MVTLTPSRNISIEFDPSDTVQSEPYFAKHRDRFEIRDPVVSNVEQLASGVWILKPEATSLFALHETSAGQAKIMRLSEFNAPLTASEIALQRSFTELTGVAPSGAVSATGDHFIIKRVPALTTWSVGISSVRPVPPLPTTPNYPLDTVLNQKTGLEPEDQGYVLRWVHPGHPSELIDYVMTFQFGGNLTAQGYGQFELAFGGDGRAYLYEWIDDGSGFAWVLVDQWRYAVAEAVPAMPHTIRLIPHAGRYLEIRSNITERTQPGMLFQNPRLTAFSGQSVAQDAHIYETRNRGKLPPRGGGLGYPVTGQGLLSFRVRRDVLLRWQVARVTYPASGTLRDRVFTIPEVDTSSHVLAIRRFSSVRYSVTPFAQLGSTSAVAYDATTGLALAAASENWTLGANTHLLNGFTLPGRPNAIQVEVTLTNNEGAGGSYSPWFFGYEAFKIGSNGLNTNSPITIDDTHYRQSPCTRLSITGPDNDPSHETAALRVADLVNRLPRLGTRGEGRIKITTTYDPAQPTRTAVLFDGYWIKSDARLRGKLAQTYPSPNWHDYDLTCMGMWKCLHERAYLANVAGFFGKDLDPATPPTKGGDTPWKVTDAIRALLVYSGFPESQIDVPDLPLRLYGTNIDGKDTIIIQPGTNVAEFIIHLAEDYLNYFLCWDGSAGLSGMWRLKPIPRGTESAVWTFTDTLPVGRLATHAGSYGGSTTFIARDSLRENTVAPENNFLRVTGEVDGEVFAASARNPKAYNRPGENTADPNHPDYTDGRFRPGYRRHDPTLLTKQAIFFVTRRTFDLVCRAQRYARFMCPLPLIDAASIEPAIYTTRSHRPPMYGDVVNYRGNKAMVTGCVQVIRKQHHMIAQMEVRRFNDPLPI